MKRVAAVVVGVAVIGGLAGAVAYLNAAEARAESAPAATVCADVDAKADCTRACHVDGEDCRSSHGCRDFVDEDGDGRCDVVKTRPDCQGARRCSPSGSGHGR
jgi:uncharacterized membrane protein